MNDYQTQGDVSPGGHEDGTFEVRLQHRRRRKIATVWLLLLVLSVAVATGWLGVKAATAEDSLRNAARLLPELQEEVLRGDTAAAAEIVASLQEHTAIARNATADPLWRLASVLPWAGPNLRAVTEVATSADDVVRLGAAPLANVLQSLDWQSITPAEGGIDVTPMKEAAPAVASAANAVQQSSERLNRINSANLLPQVSGPLKDAREQLGSLRTGLRTAADFVTIAPAMLGSEEPRHYLLLVQNIAETRATGGISGALAVLSIDQGRLALGSQSSATELSTFAPPIAVDSEQRQIYSTRLGKFMQDVNLTPDFPSAANTAQAMWEERTDQRVDGVISVDPVALSYILAATGPVRISGTNGIPQTAGSLPTHLTRDNVVQTLLSDVYRTVAEPELQDAYFAAVAESIFTAISEGKADPGALVEGLARGTEERRVLVWADSAAEQSIIDGYPISGSISGPSVEPAQFGVYFNDGTGAKMDFYVKRTVQLIKECPLNGYEQTTIRVTSTNTAPSDAATALPPYVTGDGNFGVPSGSVETNVVAYGPVQAHVETAKLDGQHTGFAPYLHSHRPVGVLAIRLAPGESRTVDFTFGKIVQHAEPNVVVTPGVQDVKNVVLPTEDSQCG